jgi:hypothetical protein
MNEIAKLVPTKPDREVAEELKAELMEAAKPWLEACAKAHKAGFIVQAQFAPNFLSQYIVQSLQLIKTY